MDSSEHFKRSELSCKCGCRHCEMNEKFMYALEALREYLGFPLVITSGYRCLKHPVEAVKDKGGYHTVGRAVDIACTDSVKRFKIVTLAPRFGLKGVGISKNFIHLDNREHGKMWVY